MRKKGNMNASIKKATWYILSLIVIYILGCNKDGVVLKHDTSPFIFTAINIDEPQVRMSGSQWDNGDQIGIFAIKSGSELNEANIIDGSSNMPYETVSNSQFFPKDKYLYYPKDGSAMDIISYYPYSEAVKDYKYPINLNLQKDILYSSNLKGMSLQNKQDKVLNFKRPLSKLVVHVSPNEENSSLDGLSAKAIGTATKGDLMLTSGKIEIDNSSKGDVVLNITGNETSKQVTALLFPTEEGENVKISFGFPNGKTFTWQVPHSMASGKVYSYNIKLDDVGAEVASSGYMEIPEYSLANEAPNSIQAMHMVGSTSWLNPSFEYADNEIRNYTVLYDKENRVPYWIAFPMHPMYLASGNRTDHWDFDPIIPQEYQPSLFSSWSTRDLDRGHLMASADRNATREINKTTFYFTNMCPQNQTMNGGNWATLENKVRSWTSQVAYDTLYVVTGTILPKTPEKFTYTTDDNGDQSVVPSYLYKALLRKNKSSGEYTSIAFKMANDNSMTHYSETAISVEELEEETGFTFFKLLPATKAKQIKQNKNISPHWN